MIRISIIIKESCAYYLNIFNLFFLTQSMILIPVHDFYVSKVIWHKKIILCYFKFFLRYFIVLNELEGKLENVGLKTTDFLYAIEFIFFNSFTVKLLSKTLFECLLNKYTSIF